MLRPGLSQRIILGFCILSLSVLILMTSSIGEFAKVVDSSRQLAENEDFLKTGAQLDSDLIQLVQAQVIFDQFLKEQTWRNYFEFNDRLEELLSRLKGTAMFARRAREMKDLEHLHGEMANLLANATFTINPRFPVGAVSPASLEKIRQSRTRIHDKIRDILADEGQSRRHLADLLRQHLQTLRGQMILVVVLLLAGGVLFAGYLHRAALEPLRRLIEVIRKPDPSGIPLQIVPAGSQEMRQLIESFNHLTQALRLHQKKQASMLTWAVKVAHEVRNPLAAIGTAIQVLESGFPADHPDKPMFQEIFKEVYRANGIISDLLEFSRPRPLSLEPTRWTQLIEEMRLLLTPNLSERRITLETTVDPPADEGFLDPLQIHRVLLNLVTNAAEAVGLDGRIRLVVSGLGPDQFLLVVEDSGPGIPVEDRERVFDPFFSRKNSGTGLGLTIVAEIVEGHGGRIRVTDGQSLPGARFEIELPRRNLTGTGDPGETRMIIPGKIVQGKET